MGIHSLFYMTGFSDYIADCYASKSKYIAVSSHQKVLSQRGYMEFRRSFSIKKRINTDKAKIKSW